eukprot:SAG11_NODE_574_length_8430_cov_11.461769_2_plen_35_part_00
MGARRRGRWSRAAWLYDEARQVDVGPDDNRLCHR